MREMRRVLVLSCVVAGCTGQGSLDLQLSLPTAPELRPTGMTTVEVLATSPNIEPIANRSVLNGSFFSAGELPVADDVQLSVLLHDVSNRLVGLGEAPALVDIVGDKATTVSIPVRRPFIYASSGTTLYTFDPTLDPRDGKFQGKLDGLTTPQVAVSVGGDRLVVGGQSTLQVIDTATHKVTGGPIAMPGGGMIKDVAPVPGANIVAVAHTGGIAIVNLADGSVQNAEVGPVDRIAVGQAPDKRMVAYGLVGRVAPADSQLSACGGSSSIVAVFVDAPAATAPKPLPMGASAIAAAPSQAAVFATIPCQGHVVKIEGDPTSEVATLTFTMMSMLPNASTIAVLGDRVFAAGTRGSSPVCATASGNVTQCTTTTQVACPEPNATHLSYVTAGARLVVQSIPVGGGNPVELQLPEERETMISTDDPAEQHAQVLHPLSSVPLDLVALPGGQYVSLVTKNSYYIESLSDGFTVLLPCLKVTTGNWYLIDMASSSVAQRVRPSCDLVYGMNAYFRMWKCDNAPEGQRPTLGEFMPVGVGALFGAR
ncbi:MAG TPA: hypothetical protein VMZ53_03260 [Kofleriaceae bacterium]|nr:hypothetical protein [Kofleriaceae bacterium]